MVKIGTRKALFREGVWRCADPALEQRLNSETESWFLQTGGPALNSLDPEGAVAAEIAGLCGGAILLRVPAKLKRVRAKYFQFRQFSFDFSSGE